jgi:hypothetical protein
MQTDKKTEPYCACSTCYRHPYSAIAKEHRAINRVMVRLDEKNRRRFAGVLVLQWGRGGLEQVAQITGLSRPTIRRGCKEIRHSESPAEHSRVRTSGAGRLRVEKNNRV